MKDDGGPAFPGDPENYVMSGGKIIEDYSGMTLRDYFASQVAGALFTQLEGAGDQDEAAHMVADMSYRTADAMLKARTNA